MTVRILFVEDSQDDVELQLRRLREAGLEPQWDRVQSEVALRATLADETWHVALVDYNIPGFSGVEALRLIRELVPDLPAITVSGSIDEDTAVATMSAGAMDYVLKDNLTRLPPAVRRAVDGADLRRAHRQAAESASLALFALDHASLAITTVARDGTVVYLNEHACRSFDGERSELIGKRIWEHDAGMAADSWEHVRERVTSEGAIEFRVDRRRPDGSRLILDVTANYLEGADVVISYGRDVTRRVEAEERARESDALYRRIVETAQEGIWVVDADYRTTFVNEQMATMLGYRVDEMLGASVADFMHAEEVNAQLEALSESQRLPRGTYQARFRRKDGGEVITGLSFATDSDADGQVRSSFGMFADITERVRADEALRAERANLAAIFEASPVAMMVFDEHANVVRVNRATLRLAGSDEERLLEHQPDSEVKCGDVLGCEHHAEAKGGCGASPECPLCPLRNAVSAVLAGGLSLRGVELGLDVMNGDGGDVLWLRVGAEPMLMNGAPHVTVAIDDITDRRRAKNALRESEERFRSLAERVPGYVSIKDSEQRYLYLSSLVGSHVRGGREAWLGRRAEDLWGPADAAVLTASASRALAGEMVDEVVASRLGDEQHHYHSLHFQIPREGSSPLVGGLMIDVTEQIEAQDEVRRQAEQLRRTVEGAVLAMSQVVETRDPYTAGHERRVAELATAIAREMGWDGAELDGLRLGSLIHDIGKISVPAEILAKPGRLSVVEFNLIKQHSRAGFDILSVIDFGRPVAEMVLQHHERLDGSGYPSGLTGDDLLPETHILAVADVVEAMSSHRPYRPALGIEAALAEVREGAGSRYDPDVAAACDRVITEQGFRFSP